ncbi:MAG TPA: DUF6519 domain-containing protein, partial [Thermomicrobiales bacterium]|nr:DUF6519 domain-containing protein [Thermomicrobiales bacterium]
MRGDFTRSTFRPEKHYSGVRLQQGRVQLDADWNEQGDIGLYRDRTAVRDAVGPCGVPHHGPDEFRHFRLRPSAQPFEADPGERGGEEGGEEGGAVVAAGQSLDIAAGRLYVDGVLCENDADAPASSAVLTNAADQPHLPPHAPIVRRADGTEVALPAPAGTYLAYLDAWERDVTALEDPAIREDALGGPDTATRTQTVWQVRLLELAPAGEVGVSCLAASPAWDALVAAGAGRLRARARPSAAVDGGPCLVPPGGGFRRLENQLYRVEVHRGGPPDAATFKWSRENGSVVTAWLAQDGPSLVVAGAGRDAPLGFAAGDWVELTDDTRELQGCPGVLVQLADVRGQVLTLNPDTAERVPVAEAPGATEPPDAAGTVRAVIRLGDFPRNPKVRRWDLPASATGAPVIALAADPEVYLPLEDGVEVRFEVDGGGAAPAAFRAGDYWLIPARTLTADVEWPREGGGAGPPAAVAPHGVRHHFCRLAIVRADGAGQLTVAPGDDCRPRFPALTELTAFFYAGGDGQSARPDPAGTELRQPLRAGVANGRWPVAGARVRFATAPGNGTLHGLAPAPGDGGGGNELVVETDEQGIAACRWRLSAPAADGSNLTQAATATLLDAVGEARHLPLAYSAALNVAAEVGYTPGGACTNLAGVTTVQQALDELCKTGDNIPGIHVKEVRTIDPDAALPNDGSVAAPLLAGGLRVVCDGAVDGRALAGKPVCTLTLALPFPFNEADRRLWGDDVIGFQPLELRGTAEAREESIVWLPADDAVRKFLLDTLFAQMAEQGRGNRVLARLTLKGNFIWDAADGRLYLDGDVFGVPAQGDLTELDLPSGDNRRGGDFETWFWLEPERPGLKALTLEQASVTGGAQAVRGFVTLSQRAPSGATTTVVVTSDDPSVTIAPATVTIAPGTFGGEFSVTTSPVAAPRTVTITARFPNSDDLTATLTVQPPRLVALTLGTPPATLFQTGQANVTGAVTLDGPAPASGIAVALASGNPQLATVPAGGTVTVPANQRSQTFTVRRAGTAGGQVTITGTLGESRAATLQLLPRLAQFGFNGTASAVVRQRTIGGTVTLGNAVPFEVRVALTSSIPVVATPPAAVVVPPNAQVGSFAVAGAAFGVTGITAALDGSPSLALNLAVVPRLVQYTLAKTPVNSGDAAQGIVRLESAPPLPVVVALGSANTSLASPPASVTIQANTAEHAFTIGTGFVAALQTVTLTAALAGVAPPVGGESFQAVNLTVAPVKQKEGKEKEKDVKEKELIEEKIGAGEKIRAEKIPELGGGAGNL